MSDMGVPEFNFLLSISIPENVPDDSLVISTRVNCVENGFSVLFNIWLLIEIYLGLLSCCVTLNSLMKIEISLVNFLKLLASLYCPNIISYHAKYLEF